MRRGISDAPVNYCPDCYPDCPTFVACTPRPADPIAAPAKTGHALLWLLAGVTVFFVLRKK